MRLFLCVAALAFITSAVKAAGPEDSSAAKTAITERLVRWTATFNARELDVVCDLFAPDLRYTVDDNLNGSRERYAQISTPCGRNLA
jgi:hypothetical protein